MRSWRRTQITRLSYKHRDFHVTLVIQEKEKRWCLDGVSQRQICAGVCHLTCRHDMKMKKQTASLRRAAVPYGSYRGHRWLDEVVERIFLGSAVGQRWDKAKWAHEAQRVQSCFFSKAKKKMAVIIRQTGKTKSRRTRQPDITIVTSARLQIFKWDYMKTRGVTDEWTQIGFRLFTLLQLCKAPPPPGSRGNDCGGTRLKAVVSCLVGLC